MGVGAESPNGLFGRATNIGWVDAIAEVYRIGPMSGERCNLRWIFAASFRGGLSRIEPLVGRVLPAVQRRLLKKLERVAGRRSVRA